MKKSSGMKPFAKNLLCKESTTPTCIWWARKFTGHIFFNPLLQIIFLSRQFALRRLLCDWGVAHSPRSYKRPELFSWVIRMALGIQAPCLCPGGSAHSFHLMCKQIQRTYKHHPSDSSQWGRSLGNIYLTCRHHKSRGCRLARDPSRGIRIFRGLQVQV